MAPPVTRDPKDPDFPHGEPRGFARGCLDDCCRIPYMKRQKAQRVRAARGLQGTLDADHIRAHLRSLLESHPDITAAACARAAGLDKTTVQNVLRRNTKTFYKDNGMAILALTRDRVLDEVLLVSVDRPRQQIKSMMALGWPGQWIEARLGYTRPPGPPRLLSAPHQYVAKWKADKIAALYAEVGDTWGPSRRTALYAGRRGWLVPGAYDDDGNLIPGAARGTEEEEAYRLRALATAERRLQVKTLSAQGMAPAQIEKRLGLDRRIVDADIRRPIAVKGLRMLKEARLLDGEPLAAVG